MPTTIKEVRTKVIQLTRHLTEEADKATKNKYTFGPSYLNGLTIALQQIALELVEIELKE